MGFFSTPFPPSQRAAPRAIGGTPQPCACGTIFFSLVPSRTHRVAFFRVHGSPRAVFGVCERAGPGAAAGRDRPRRDAQRAASHSSFDLAPRGRPGAPRGRLDGDSTVHTDELLAQEDFLLISMLGTPRARCFPLRAACVSLLPHAVRSLFSMCGVGSRPGHCLVAESGGVCCPCLSAAITSGTRVIAALVCVANNGRKSGPRPCAARTGGHTKARTLEHVLPCSWSAVMGSRRREASGSTHGTMVQR